MKKFIGAASLIGNAFSLGMLGLEIGDSVIMRDTCISLEQAREMIDPNFVSCVGHIDTANVFTNLLGKDVAFNRINAKLEVGDVILVGQLGARLPEGATSLPEGFKLSWHFVEILG